MKRWLIGPALAVVAVVGMLGIAPRSAEAYALARANGPYAGAVGQSISFTAAGSVGVQFRWYFNDGTTAEGFTVTHAFAAPGVYQVLLAVSDGFGATSTEYAQTVIGAVTTPTYSPPPTGAYCLSWVGGVCTQWSTAPRPTLITSPSGGVYDVWPAWPDTGTPYRVCVAWQNGVCVLWRMVTYPVSNTTTYPAQPSGWPYWPYRAPYRVCYPGTNICYWVTN